jgi:hypothetical protein
MVKPSLSRISIAFVAFSFAALAGAQGKAPATDGEKEAYAIYQRTLEADRLFGESKYAEAQPIYADGLKRLVDTVKRDPNVRYYEFTVKPRELPIARSLDLDVEEITKLGTVSMTVLRFAEVLEGMQSHALQVLGKDPNWDDALILDRAVGVVLGINPPVPDAQALPATVRLRLAIDKLEALFKRNSKLKSEQLRGTRADAALADAKAKITQLSAQADGAKDKLAATPPDAVKLTLEVEMNNLARVEEALNAAGFLDDMRFERHIASPDKWLAKLAATIKQAYDAEGKTMPADVLKPVQDRTAALRKLAISKAATWKWPAVTPNPAITNKVKAQLTKNIPGLKVLKIGMQDAGWEINKNDVGIPEDRYVMGFVLYQMPGESLPRCSSFIYREQYAGGGTYTPAKGASSYPGTRWQKA